MFICRLCASEFHDKSALEDHLLEHEKGFDVKAESKAKAKAKAETVAPVATEESKGE